MWLKWPLTFSNWWTVSGPDMMFSYVAICCTLCHLLIQVYFLAFNCTAAVFRPLFQGRVAISFGFSIWNACAVRFKSSEFCYRGITIFAEANPLCLASVIIPRLQTTSWFIPYNIKKSYLFRKYPMHGQQGAVLLPKSPSSPVLVLVLPCAISPCAPIRWSLDLGG